MLTVNALVAADGVLIPMQCEYYALEGLTSLVATIEQIRAAANPTLEIEGILRTMFDPRNNLANEVSAQLMMHFGERVFRTVVPRNIRLAEAPSFGKPVLEHDPDLARGAGLSGAGRRNAAAGRGAGRPNNSQTGPGRLTASPLPNPNGPRSEQPPRAPLAHRALGQPTPTDQEGT